MSVHIAIPEPTSSDSAYNQRSLPPYLAALHSAGMTPVLIPLHERQDRVARVLLTVQGILLPGSRYDVDPERYGQTRIPECGPTDPARTAVDELLLQDAFSLHKPILAICAGLQSLNVWRNGTLIQHLTTSVDHSPGREVLDAHPIHISPGSRLAAMLPPSLLPPSLLPPFLLQPGEGLQTVVNSSHHQAIGVVGDTLIVSAVSPADHTIEAVELDSHSHFVVAVQWHPERTYTHSPFSRALFSAFAQAATIWEPRRIEASVVAS